jgi:hypothetical protein
LKAACFASTLLSGCFKPEVFGANSGYVGIWANAKKKLVIEIKKNDKSFIFISKKTDEKFTASLNSDNSLTVSFGGGEGNLIVSYVKEIDSILFRGLEYKRFVSPPKFSVEALNEAFAKKTPNKNWLFSGTVHIVDRAEKHLISRGVSGNHCLIGPQHYLNLRELEQSGFLSLGKAESYLGSEGLQINYSEKFWNEMKSRILDESGQKNPTLGSVNSPRFIQQDLPFVSEFSVTEKRTEQKIEALAKFDWKIERSDWFEAIAEDPQSASVQVGAAVHHYDYSIEQLNWSFQSGIYKKNQIELNAAESYQKLAGRFTS